MTIVGRHTSGVVVAFAILGSVVACGSSNSATAPSTAPQITSCSTVSYQGTSWNLSGCDPAFGQAPSSVYIDDYAGRQIGLLRRDVLEALHRVGQDLLTSSVQV